MSGRHWLVVGPWDPEDPDIMEVEHDGCVQVENHGVVEWTCAVGFYIAEYGISEYFQHADDEDSFFSAYVDKVSLGRYEIEAWHRRHPAGPWGPEEHDAGVRLVEEVKK